MKEANGIFMDAMQEFYQGLLSFHGAYALVQLCRELYADFFYLFFIFSIFLPTDSREEVS